MTSNPTRLRDLLASPYVLDTIWQSQIAVQQFIYLDSHSGSEFYQLNIDLTEISEISIWLSSPYNTSTYDIAVHVINSGSSTTVVQSNGISIDFTKYSLDITSKPRSINDVLKFYQDSGNHLQVADKSPKNKTGYSIEQHIYNTSDISYSTYSTHGGQLWGLQLIKETA
jgi:hypothetical protein